MIIAVNTRLNKQAQPEGYEDFMFGLLGQLSEQFPGHRFIYISDRPFNQKHIFSKNVTPVFTGPKTGSALGLQYWLHYRIPAVLRKQKADVFLSLEGICSLRTKVPQCLFISDLSFLQKLPSIKKQAGFYKKNTGAFLNKAKIIAAVSEHSKNIIAGTYNIAAENIHVIHPGADKNFKPLGWEEQEAVKEKYAEGKSYFLCCTGNNLINLLKAYSLFKKRQKSHMLLLITGEADEHFKKELASYRLRKDVKLLEGLEKAELAKITAAAYTVIHPVHYDDITLPAFRAMQCHVPFIASRTGSLQGNAGDAALYFDPDNYEDIAQNMMLVFKDENKTRQMVAAGIELLNRYQTGKSAQLLMKWLTAAVQNH